MFKKLTPEQILKNKKESREAMQRAFRETAGKAFSSAKTALEGLEGAKAGGMDLAEGKASGLLKIVKPFIGGGLKMTYGKSAADKIFKPSGPAPQGPAPATMQQRCRGNNMDIMQEAELKWKIRKRREAEMFGHLPARMDDVDARIKAIRAAQRQAASYGGAEVFARRLQFPELVELEEIFKDRQGYEIDYHSFSLFGYTVFSENLPENIREIIARKIRAAIEQERAEMRDERAWELAGTQGVIAELFDLLTNGLSEGTRDAQCRIALLTLLNPCSYKGLSLQSELQPDAVYLDEEAVDEVLSRWDLKRKHAQAQEIKRLLSIVEGMYPSVTFNSQSVADFISANPTP